MKTRFWMLLMAGLLILAGGIASAQDGEEDDNALRGDPRAIAPDFPLDGIDWLNVDAPLTLDDLAGKIVILDFWTYGCINCIHMIPILQQLEEAYPDELVIIGVHSAKFENEGNTENIREIVQRYDLHHPVINDSQYRVWSLYGANAWPTFAVINPIGRVLAVQAGEIPFEPFDNLVGAMVEYFDGTGELDRTPIEFSPEGAGDPNTLLRYPGKVLADVDGNRLFIADSNHHRIVVADLTTYEVLYTIGTGQRGFADGEYDSARFNKPQGMALRDGVLYVADTDNHAIRAVDLTTQTVTTIAGTGERGGFEPYIPNTRPLEVNLRSPWDLEFGEGNLLYIAMAGTHQIWRMDIAINDLLPYVGNGREALINRELATSELAQPSGLYYVDGLLYFADSESSTIRVADIENDSVITVSGVTENSLFDFGDVDGEPGTSRLQHPLGVTGDGESVFITDTYNSRIKLIDAGDITTTLTGTGENAYSNGDFASAQFNEPGGLDYAELNDGRRVLFVADTNNHVIRLIDLDAETVSTINFPNPEVLQIEDAVTLIGGGQDDSRRSVTLDEQMLSAGASDFVLTLILPDGYKINEIAESFIVLTGDETITVEDANTRTPITETELTVPLTLNDGAGTLTGEVTIYFCEDENATLCFIDEFTVDVPITVSDGGDSLITIERELIPPIIVGGGIG